MAAGIKFFFYPFGVTGTLTPIPDPSQSGGAVSYNTGFTANYELPLNTNPNALAINRGNMNSLFNDITTALQDIQTKGVPSWIGPSNQSPPDYSGNYPYPINAYAYYTDGNVYQSVIASNTDTPGATANWVNISSSAGAMPIGSVIDFAGLAPPVNHLNCLGQAVSRTTYAGLFAVLSSSQNGVLNGTITVTGLASTANLQPGFYVSDGNVDIPAGTQIATIVSGTSVTLTLAATGSTSTAPLVFAPWGIGDGVTTFEVPDFTRSYAMGSGGTSLNYAQGVPGTWVGQVGGVEGTTMTAGNFYNHTHTTSIPAVNVNNASGGATQVSQQGPGSNNYTSGGVNGGAGNAPFNSLPPTNIVFKCIKFQ